MNLTTLKQKIKTDEIIKKICDNSFDAEIYLVGGVLRDFMMEIDNFDKDIIVDGTDAKTFALKLANTLDASFVPLDEENKIYRIVLKDKINYIDIANIIGKNLNEDLKRRDLTINALAFDLKNGELIDITGAMDDLENKTLSHISEENIIDDPLRMLRVLRFHATLGFKINPETIKIIKKHAQNIAKVAVERINHELLKLFAGDFSGSSLVILDETDLLEKILPICADLKKVPPNSHHHLNLFEHSIETVTQIQNIYKESPDEIKSHLNQTDFGGANRLAHLKFAGFLHDIGKFQTWTIEEETGKHRFIKHDDVGAKMTKTFLKSAKFSKKQIEYICKMIKYHIYPSHVVCAPEISEKIYMRLIRKMENDVIDVITLAKADRLSARGIEITETVVNNNINALNALENFYLSVKDGLKPLPKLLSGEDIMQMLNLKPSKELGSIIKALQEAQTNGDITTKEEAICFVRGKYEN